MQSILSSTTSSPILVTGMEVAKIQTGFLAWYWYLHSGSFCCSYILWLHWHYNLNSFLFLLNLSKVGNASWNLLFFIAPFLVLFLFAFFAGRLKNFACLNNPKQVGLYIFYLRLLWIRIFGSCSLSLFFWSNAIRKTITSRLARVCVSNHGARL